MENYCDVVDKTIKMKNKIKHLQCKTHYDIEKCIRTNHTIKNLDSFDIDEMFKNYIINHNKKVGLYLVKYDFIIILDGKFCPHNFTELRINQSKFQLKNALCYFRLEISLKEDISSLVFTK